MKTAASKKRRRDTPSDSFAFENPNACMYLHFLRLVHFLWIRHLHGGSHDEAKCVEVVLL